MVNRRLQVVMADDDKDEHFFLEEAIKLSSLSCAIKSFYDGSTILDYLKTENFSEESENARPDLIILDINMPCYNGVEVLKEIKADAALQNIPVFIYTTTAERTVQELCINLGASDFFTKPSNLKDLKGIVETIFSGVAP